MKIIGKLDRRQVIGLLMSCIPFMIQHKIASSSEKQVEPADPISKSCTHFYLMSGWVLAESDLEFFSRGELGNAKRLQ